jgi:uncharacterized protein (DUF362 family)
MALDLARILTYGDREGKLTDQPQRQHLLMTDGIIAGEGDGPLSPKPVQLGYLSFSNNIVSGDFVNCLAMGFNPDRIPLIREALKLKSLPLCEGQIEQCVLLLNKQETILRRIGEQIGSRFLPPQAWRGSV